MNQIQAVLEVGPGATPLLLDIDGNVAETNAGNFFFVSEGQLRTSRGRNVLAGVTRSAVFELAAKLGMEIVEGDFAAYDIYTAEEAFGTSPTIAPAAASTEPRSAVICPIRTRSASFAPSPTSSASTMSNRRSKVW